MTDPLSETGTPALEAPIRVAVVDDHAVVREGIRRVLESDPGILVVGEGKDGEEALILVSREDPDVLVIDVAMPGRNGLQIAAELARLGAPTRVLVLSMYDEPEYILQSVTAGARGYLLKDSLPAELRRAVRTVHRGSSSSRRRSPPGSNRPAMPRRRPHRSTCSRPANVTSCSASPAAKPTRKSRPGSGSRIAPWKHTARA